MFNQIYFRPQTDWYWRLYGKDVVAKYRERALARFGRAFFSKEYNYGTPLAVKLPGRRPDGLATFWEFVQFVIDTP